MTRMIMSKGEIITIASGAYETYDRGGPFIVVKDFDLDAFVEGAKTTISEAWEVTGLMGQIPQLLVEQGLIAPMHCRNVYLGDYAGFDLGEEKQDLNY